VRSGTSTTRFCFIAAAGAAYCVDPNPQAIPEWKQLRPGDTHIVAAVGEEERSVFWHAHKVSWGKARVTLDGNRSDKSWYAGQQVPMRRLDNLFAEHLAGREIQFMTIAVEGAELGVLRSNDWTRWRPELILLECVGVEFSAPFAQEPVKYLIDQGYSLCSKLNDNLVFLRT